MEADEFEALFSEQRSLEPVDVPVGAMSPLERFKRIMSFQPVDRVIDREFGYWNDTYRRWHTEGLPRFIDNEAKANVYFGFDNWSRSIPANTNLQPAFEVEVLEDRGQTKIIYDSNRVKCEVFSDGTDTIPHYLDFPIKDRESYLPFKERLVPNLEKRIKTDLQSFSKKVENRNYVLMAPGGSTAGMVRNWMGFEDICLAIYDQPELLEEILDDLSEVSSNVAAEICAHMTPDLVCWWEDIAYKNGPIVTPDWFKETCGKAIKKVMDVYRGAGVEHAFVDCDGDFRSLMPGWLDNGVDIMFPLEVASGVHPENLRKENSGIRMMGGFDKVALIKGKSEIRKELNRLKPLVEEGGFIPHVDHRVQPDVSLENYLYYLEAKRDIFGIENRVSDETLKVEVA
jgi:uroporphyrinogen-III decarboxylase